MDTRGGTGREEGGGEEMEGGEEGLTVEDTTGEEGATDDGTGDDDEEEEEVVVVVAVVAEAGDVGLVGENGLLESITFPCPSVETPDFSSAPAISLTADVYLLVNCLSADKNSAIAGP